MALTVDTAIGEMLREAVKQAQLDLAVDLINARGADPDYMRGVYRGLSNALALLEDCEKTLAEH